MRQGRFDEPASEMAQLYSESVSIDWRLYAHDIKGSLAQFLYINWQRARHQDEYIKLIEACRAPTKATSDKTAVPSWQSGAAEIRPIATEPLPSIEADSVLFEGHKEGVLAVAISSDNQLIVSGSKDGCIRVWDTKSGRCNQILKAKNGGVREIVLDGYGRVYSACGDGKIQVWDMATQIAVASDSRAALMGFAVEVRRSCICRNLMLQ